uniref:Secreted peptide n=1 Tax=Octopus bimaculoides TaxID=37653 RepID=A0A0L8FW88_OCTBM
MFLIMMFIVCFLLCVSNSCLIPCFKSRIRITGLGGGEGGKEIVSEFSLFFFFVFCFASTFRFIP